MARLKKHEKEQVVYVHYGINRDRFIVEAVYQTRSGTLSVWRGDNRLTHGLAGRDGRSECIIVFGLTNIYSIPVSMDSSELTKQKLSELKGMAEAMKVEAESKKPTP
jgi:hypothetical protein